MKKEKKQIVLNGSLLRPLSVGRGAILHAGGNIYHTSRVVAILEESEDCVRFETQNSHYHLSMSPFPLAAVSPLPVRLAACAWGFSHCTRWSGLYLSAGSMVFARKG